VGGDDDSGGAGTIASESGIQAAVETLAATQPFPPAGRLIYHQVESLFFPITVAVAPVAKLSTDP
jgi:hypothetical protein